MTPVGTAPPSGPELRTMWDEVAAAFCQWQEGTTTADPLVRLMTPVLWQVARSCRLPEEAARDVIQDAWLALVRHRDTITSPRAVAAWLITTTRRAAWTARSRMDTTGATLPDEALELALPSVDAAEEVALARSESEVLWRAVGRLSERCQHLVRVVAFSPRPDYAALSVKLGMPVGSVGPTRRRCLDKLRSELTALGAPTPETEGSR